MVWKGGVRWDVRVNGWKEIVGKGRDGMGLDHREGRETQDSIW